MTRAELFAAAKQLDSKERDELIADLQELSEPAPLTAEQWAEVERRVDELDSGKVQAIDGELVMKEAREVVRRIRGS